jgi:two-component sensor histidine kinase
MRLAQRVAVVLMAGLLPVVAVGIWNTIELRHAKRVEVENSALRQAELASSELQRMFEGVRGVLFAVAQTQAVQSSDPVECSAYLTSIASALDYMAGISVLDKNGVVWCSSDPQAVGADVSDRSYLKTALAADTFTVGEYLVGRVTGQPVLPVSLPVHDAARNQAGAIVASINLQWISDQLKERGVPEGGSVTVADRSGVILARQPFPEKFVGTKIPDQFIYLLSASAPGATDVISQDGTARVLGFVPTKFSPDGIYVSAGLSKKESFSVEKSAILRESVVSTVIVVASVLTAFLLSRLFISNPMEQLLQTVRQWQSGNLSARTNLKRPDGEIGELGEEFDRTMDALDKRNESINVLMRELVHRSKNQIMLLSGIVRQVAKGQDSVDSFRDNLLARFSAMAATQDLMLQDPGAGIDLDTLIHRQLDAFHIGDGASVQTSGPRLVLDEETARYLGMAFHELGTNALKYGALSHANGFVTVEWNKRGSVVDLTWSEQDGPTVAEPQSFGFGRTLLDKIVPAQLNGTAQISYAGRGLRWSLRFVNP